MGEIYEIIKSSIVQWLALGLGIINLILYIKDKEKEKLKIEIIQEENDEAYSFEYYDNFDCERSQYEFCYIRVINKSKAEADLAKIFLTDASGGLHEATYFGKKTYPLDPKAELCFVEKDISSRVNFRVDSHNILNNKRIKSYGELEGYLVFQNVPPLRQNFETFTLQISGMDKTFSGKVTFKKLPDEYAFLHEVKRNPNSKK